MTTPSAPLPDRLRLLNHVYVLLEGLRLGVDWELAPPIKAEIAALAKELETLLAGDQIAPEADPWQPIETAPFGEVLLYRPQLPPRDRIAVRRAADWCGETCCPSAQPTHWMPLPNPPSCAAPCPDRTKEQP